VAAAHVFAPPRRAFAAPIIAAVVALFVLGSPSTHAMAAPTVAQIEAQIDTMWNQVEPVIELYNSMQIQLNANKAKADALAQKLQPLQLQVDLAMSAVSDIAVQFYKGGPASGWNAILSSGSPTTLADQLSLLNQLAHTQRMEINSVAVVRDKYAADKKALDDLIAQQAPQVEALAAKKKDIEAQIAALQQLRIQAYGSPDGGTGVLKPVACPVEYVGGVAGKAITLACQQIGKPYVFATPQNMALPAKSFDCSGLVAWVWYQAAHVTLNHSARDQFAETQRVAYADLRPGDVAFFYGDRHHVAIYAGGGWFVNASRSGVPVKMSQLSQMGPVNGYGRVRA
jgi:cell wall-associated NlpC family hydrolase